MSVRTPRKKKSTSRQVAFTRFMLIVAFFTAWMLGISARLVHLQVTQHDWLREKAADQRQDVKKSKLLRGTIFDRDGRPLAMSIRVKSLYADPTEIEDVDKTCKYLAKTLKLDPAKLFLQISEAKATRKRYMPLVKKLDEETVQKLNKALAVDDIQKSDLPLYPGLHWAEDQIRSYPYGEMAAQVIGFSSLDDVGMAGIEQNQDDILHGAVIKKLQERDRLGRIYDETIFDREKPSDIALTIGTSYQYKTEQALANGVRASNAKSGMAVALSVKTGEVLAMANYPSFDPNTIKDAVAANITNHTIQDVYSPGSVLKVVTYGSGLEKKLFLPDDQIDAGNGTIQVSDHKFSDSHHVGTVTYSQALAHSSNVCAIKTGLRVGKDDFYAMLRSMGFGSKTGIELPAETSGIVRSPDKWNGDSLASMSIGYEIGVTALQMATAFATIANDGVKIQPRLIKEIRKSDEKPVAPKVSEDVRVVSIETARNLRTMLRQVVLTGTGRRAQLSGYTSAGKTGTAWKFDPVAKRVDSSKYISSFIGMAPADNPEIVIAVVIDEPKNGPRDGGQVAAPVFRQIAEQILPELNVRPDGPAVTELPIAQDIPESPKRTESEKTEDSRKSGGKNAAAVTEKGEEPPKKTKEIKKEGDRKQGNGKKGPDTTSADILRIEYRKSRSSVT